MFAYKIIPNLPVLGLAEEGVAGKGEEQFQILGGTEIIELYRFKKGYTGEL